MTLALEKWQLLFVQLQVEGCVITSVSDPDPGILTSLDPDPGQSRQIRIRILNV